MNQQEYKALFSSGLNHDISDEKEIRILNEEGSRYTVEYNSTIYNIIIEDFDAETKCYKLIVNNKPIELTLKNNLDQLIEKMGLNKKSEENFTHIKAPMPGLVLKVHVNEGDTIAEGDSLVTLEAMKMENLLKSKGQATVKKILVETNDKVEKSQVLIEFE